MKLTRHRVKDMVGFVQVCLDCGKTISDYRNAFIVDNSPLPQGFPAGNVYVGTGNPQMSCTDAGMSSEDYKNVTPCNAN